MSKIYKDEDYIWQRCPHCGADLQFTVDSLHAIEHLKGHAQDQAEAHPEVGDQLSLDEGVEAEDKLFPER